MPERTSDGPSSGRVAGLAAGAEYSLLNPHLGRIPLVLPTELLEHIARYADLQTAVALSSTSITLHRIAEPYIWRDIDIRPPDPYRRSAPSNRLDAAFESLDNFQTRAEKHKEAVLRKVRGVLAAGNTRRWGLVERLAVCCRPGSTSMLATLLELVSPTVQVLKITGADEQFKPGDWSQRTDFASLDISLLDSRTHFLSLTHLFLGPRALLRLESLPILCDAAPELIYLDVELRAQKGDESRWYPSDITTPSWPIRETKIRRMRFICDYSVFYEEQFGADEAEEAEHVYAFMKRCTQLEQLSIGVDLLSDLGTLLEDLLEIVSSYQHLECLHWQWLAWSIHGHVSSPGSFPALRVLVLDVFSEILSILSEVVYFPNIEMIVYDQCGEKRTFPPDYSHIPAERVAMLSSVQPMPMRIAKAAVASPHLRALWPADRPYPTNGLDQFAQLEATAASGAAAGYISSFRYGDEELLHAHMLLEFVEVADVAHPIISLITHTFHDYHDANSGDKRRKDFDDLPEPVWQHFSSFREKAVPMDVIEAMREKEGKTKDDWYRRGVEVGDDAWSILEQWMAKQ